MEGNFIQSNSVRFLFKLFLAIFILFVAWSAFNYIRHIGLIKTVVVAVPDDSQIYVDEAPKKGGAIYLKPGAHTLRASRQYFNDDVQKIDTKNVISSEKIYLLPNAVSAEAKQWLAEHPDIQKERETAGGARADRRQRLIDKDYPIINSLPYENSHFKVDYSISLEGKPEFVISLFGIINRPSQYNEYITQLKQYKLEALKYLKDNKIDPDQYKIKYIPNVPEQ